MVCLFFVRCTLRKISDSDEKVGGDLSLGESFETLEKEDNRYLFAAVGKAVKLVSIVSDTKDDVDE